MSSRDWDHLEGTRVVRQFRLYPYLKYAKIVINRNIQSGISMNIPKEISKLCEQYYFCQQDGIFQLAQQISITLQKLNKEFITMELLHVIIKILFDRYSIFTLKTTEIALYSQELIRLKYIIPVTFQRDIIRFNKFMSSDTKLIKLQQTYKINISKVLPYKFCKH